MPFNALVGETPTPSSAPVSAFAPGGAADRHPMTGGIGRTTQNNPPLTLALIVLGSVAVLGALNLAGFRGTIAIGRT
jgi:hypothetical protein